MPIYVFECPVCGRRKEMLRRMGDLQPAACDCIKGARGEREQYAMLPVVSRTSFRLNFGPLAGIPEEQQVVMHDRERFN